MASANNQSAGRHWPSWAFAVVATLLVLAGDLSLKSWSFQNVAVKPVIVTPDSADDPLFWHKHTHQPISVVPSVLSLKLTLNSGAVFGLGKGKQWVFILLSIAAVAVLGRVFWTMRAGAYWSHLGLALIMAGALGNLYDRIRFNAVRDMLWLFPEAKLPFGWRWPGSPGDDHVYPWIFNLADAALVVGVAVLLLIMWRVPKPQQGDRKDLG